MADQRIRDCVYCKLKYTILFSEKRNQWNDGRHMVVRNVRNIPIHKYLLASERFVLFSRRRHSSGDVYDDVNDSHDDR
jgi:hypothetical protein